VNEQAKTMAIPERYHALLDRCHHAILSTIRYTDGLISTNPVGFVWEKGQIRISTIKARMKYKNLLANPLATFCVISPDDVMEYLEIRGVATLEDDEDLSFSRKQFIRGAGVEPPEDMDPPGTERVIITLQPQQISSPKLYGGRFNKK